MTLLPAWLLALGGIAVIATLLWLLSLALRNASIVDVAWGPGFAAVAVWSAAVGGGYGPRRVLVAALACAWGLRLGTYIFLRNRGHGEDPRYQAMRRSGGERWWWRSYLQVFLLQGALLWFIALPLVWATTTTAHAGLWWTDALGAVAWCVGFAFEAVGDWQLARFKADPANRGRVMDQGLWRLTRHPNYFGDALLWWGLFLLAASTPAGIVTALGPLAMTVLLVRVSGVALLERTRMSRKPGYAEYVARTSAFVPWFPRSRAGR